MELRLGFVYGGRDDSSNGVLQVVNGLGIFGEMGVEVSVVMVWGLGVLDCSLGLGFLVRWGLRYT